MVDDGGEYLGGGVVREESALAADAVRVHLRFDRDRLEAGEDGQRALEVFERSCDVYASIAGRKARGVAWMRVCARDAYSLTVEGAGRLLTEDSEPTPDKLDALLATVYWSLRDAHGMGLGAVGRIDPRWIRMGGARARREYQIEPCFGWVRDEETGSWREATARDELAAIGRLVFEVAANRPEVPRSDRVLRIPFPAGHRVWRFLSEGNPEIEDLWRRRRCEELVAWAGDASLEAIEDRMPARPRRLRPPKVVVAPQDTQGVEASHATEATDTERPARSGEGEPRPSRRGWVVIGALGAVVLVGGGSWYLLSQGGSAGGAGDRDGAIEEQPQIGTAQTDEPPPALEEPAESERVEETEVAGEGEPDTQPPPVDDAAAEGRTEIATRGDAEPDETEPAPEPEIPAEAESARRRLFDQRWDQARQSMRAALAGLDALGLGDLPLRDAWERRLEEIRAKYEANADGDALERESDDLLQQIRDAIDLAGAGRAPAETLGHDLRDLVLARRRDALHTLLEAGGLDIEGEPALTIDEAHNLAAWTERIERFARAIEDVQQGWQQWRLPNESFQTPDGPTTLLARLREAIGVLEESPELRGWVDGLSGDDAIRRLLALDELGAMYGTDEEEAREVLRRVIDDARDPRELQWAWFSPAFVGAYPDAVERLTWSRGLLERLRSIEDLPRRDELEAQWVGRATGLWDSAWAQFLREHADDGLEAWVARARELGGLYPDGQMPGIVTQRLAYNDALLAARRGEQGARDRALALADALENLAIDDATMRQTAREQARTLREVVARADRASQSLLLPTLEQGGWRIVGDPMGGQIDTIHDATGVRMTYVRLAGSEPPVFLSRQEVSIGQVASLLGVHPGLLDRLRDDWIDLDAQMSGDSARIASQPLRSWVVEGGAIRAVASRDALVMQGYSSRAYIDTIRSELFEAPGADWPLNDVSPEAASVLAGTLFGGRLPTSDEFRMALAQAHPGGGPDLASANLRDGAGGGFAQQMQFSDRARQSDPDLLDAFYLDNPDLIANRWIVGGSEIRPELRSEARFWPARGDDGVTLFAPVDTPIAAGGNTPFVHLVGNVGEWVTAGGGRFEAAGGSALSAPEIGVTEPARPRAFPGSGWFDIGFRVAIEGVTQVASDGGQIEQEIIDAIGRVPAWTH